MLMATCKANDSNTGQKDAREPDSNPNLALRPWAEGEHQGVSWGQEALPLGTVATLNPTQSRKCFFQNVPTLAGPAWLSVEHRPMIQEITV